MVHAVTAGHAAKALVHTATAGHTAKALVHAVTAGHAAKALIHTVTAGHAAKALIHAKALVHAGVHAVIELVLLLLLLTLHALLSGSVFRIPVDNVVPFSVVVFAVGTARPDRRTFAVAFSGRVFVFDGIVPRIDKVFFLDQRFNNLRARRVGGRLIHIVVVHVVHVAAKVGIHAVSALHAAHAGHVHARTHAAHTGHIHARTHASHVHARTHAGHVSARSHARHTVHTLLHVVLHIGHARVHIHASLHAGHTVIVVIIIVVIVVPVVIIVIAVVVIVVVLHSVRADVLRFRIVHIGENVEPFFLRRIPLEIQTEVFARVLQGRRYLNGRGADKSFFVGTPDGRSENTDDHDQNRQDDQQFQQCKT